MVIRQNILKRKEINSELNHTLKYPLTVVVAAMGYGKTTAAWEYLNNTNRDFVWLSIEEDESSPEFIWNELTRQMIKATDGVGIKLHALGFPSDRGQRDRVIQVIEEAFYKTETVLVIDDYHFAHSDELDYLLERIVRRNIEGLHILILSRQVPKIRMEELTLKGYCYSVNSSCFEVSQVEISEYFKMVGIQVNREVVNQVYSISEGWVTAIVLAVRRYQETGIVETDKSINRLIETTVVARYSDKELGILKQLSMIDYFTPEQGVFITGVKDADQIIMDLSYENSFIRYDRKENIFRIHNIFNDYLKELNKSTSPNMDHKEIYKRSGIWCSNNNRILLGLKYLLKAKEYDLFLEEFEQARITKILDSHSKYIESLFRNVPKKILYKHPLAYLTYIGFYVTNIDGEKGSSLLEEAKAYYDNSSEILQLSRDRIMGEIQLISSYIEFNDAEQMLKCMRHAHKLLKGRSSIANKEKIITFGSPHIHYLYYREVGKFDSDINILEQLFHCYTDMADGCGIGFDYQIKAEACLEHGDWKNAEIFAQKAMYKAMTLDQISVLICSNFVLARLAIAKGNINKAQRIIDDFGETVESYNSPILTSTFDLVKGYISAVIKGCKGFTEWMLMGDIGNSEVLYQGIGFNYIVYGKYLSDRKKFIELELLCEEMGPKLKPFENKLGYLHKFIFDAIAKFNLYGWQQAKLPFFEALKIGRIDDIKLTFYEYSDQIVELLKHSKKTFEHDVYIDDLCKGTQGYLEIIQKSKNNAKAEIPLTKREKEVLAYIVKGYTNREIGTKLFIAEVTVRKNATAIYRKLSVSGRVEAVKKAMEMEAK